MTYKYLGKRVKDIGMKGLDRPIEFKRIADAVVVDFRRGRIRKKTAVGRLSLLLLLLKKDTKLKASARTKRGLRVYIHSKMLELKTPKRKRR